MWCTESGLLFIPRNIVGYTDQHTKRVFRFRPVDFLFLFSFRGTFCVTVRYCKDLHWESGDGKLGAFIFHLVSIGLVRMGGYDICRCFSTSLFSSKTSRFTSAHLCSATCDAICIRVEISSGFSLCGTSVLNLKRKIISFYTQFLRATFLLIAACLGEKFTPYARGGEMRRCACPYPFYLSLFRCVCAPPPQPSRRRRSFRL